MESLKIILIIEDDHETRVAYRNALESDGYAVVTVTNGKSALEFLARNPSVDLVLLDMNMPIMGGDEFLEIRSRDPQLSALPVVVVTGRGDESRFEVSEKMSKPIELSVLLKKVGSILKGGA